VPEHKRGLGRGLAALIPGGAEVTAETATELPVAAIAPNPDQPRSLISQEAIDELAASIGKVGVLQAIIVRPLSDGYQIIAGERRWRAAKAAGLEKVPVRIMESGDLESLELALIENLQRQDLNPMEEARGYRRLIGDHQLTQADLAERVSKSRSAIANTLRLLDLPDEIQEMMGDDGLTAGHARAVLSIPDDERRLTLARKIVHEGLSVRVAESIARLLSSAPSGERAPRPVAPKTHKIVARKLRRLLGTTVRIRATTGKSRIEIDFQGEEELERIFGLLTDIASESGAT
jgi:ParB family chromosome partitioning protein